MLGGARLAVQDGKPPGSHPVFFCVAFQGTPQRRSGRQKKTPRSYVMAFLHSGAFGLFERQLQLTRQAVHRCSRPLPGPFRLESQIPDSAPPRGDYAANSAKVAAIRMLLI